MRLRDRLGDFFRTSGYYRENSLAKTFLGVSIPRPVYDQYRKTIRLRAVFGNFDDIRDKYLGPEYNLDASVARVANEFLHALYKFDCVLDINEVPGLETALRHHQSVRRQEHLAPLKFPEPYMVALGMATPENHQPV